MENKKKVAVSALKKNIKKVNKPKAAKKNIASMDKKNREEIEKMFAFNFGCDCSSCSHHCGDKK